MFEDPAFVLILLVVLVTLSASFDFVLDLMNLRRMKEPPPPETLEIMPAERYALAQQYNREKAGLGLVSSLVGFLITLTLLLSGVLGRIEDLLRPSLPDTFTRTAAFFGLMMLASSLLALPFGIYATFSIEARYGFNKTTPGIFILDKIKGLVLGALLGAGMLWIFLWQLNLSGDAFWWRFWIIAIAFLLLANLLYVPLILPLFNKLSPLPEGELRSAIDHYSETNGFPATRIMVMDGSKRSTKANAFFSGMGRTKRVVLFDTLVNAYTATQIVSILAHEVGHYTKRHILQSFLASLLQTGLMLFLLSRIIGNETVSLALGGSSQSVALNLVASGLLFSPFSTCFGILMNLLSRKNEYEADAFAKNTSDGKALAESLIKLHGDSLSNLNPHPAYVFVHYSHPTLLQRLRALRS